MFRIIDKDGHDQIGLKTDVRECVDTCDQLNRTIKNNEFNVIALPVVHGPAADRAKAAAALLKLEAEKAAAPAPQVPQA